MNGAAGTVHVIDDDASWRTSVRRLMSAAGYDVALYESKQGGRGTCRFYKDFGRSLPEP